MKQIVKSDANIEIAIKDCKPGQVIVMDKTGKKVRKVITKCGPSKTDQSYKDITNLKNLVAQSEARGLLRANTKWEGQLDDFPAYDFQEAQFMIAKAKTTFEQIPSSIRAKFENDPAKFMQFANNPANINEMRKLGLAKTLDAKTVDGTPIPQPPPENPPHVEQP